MTQSAESKAEEGLGLLPPDHGVRLEWTDMPWRVRGEVERWLGGRVVRAATQRTGFSPGVAARLTSDDGRRVFVKAVGPEPRPDTPAMHRREARVMTALPSTAPVPRLLWSCDEGEGGWVVLVFEDLDGHHPSEPWQKAELHRVVAALEDLSTLLTPSPLPSAMVGSAGSAFAPDVHGWSRLRNEQPSRMDYVDEWSRRHIETLVAIERTVGSALMGDTLLNMDVRADNILFTPGRTWFVDWPLARVGPPWMDAVAFAATVPMQGGPPPEEVASMHFAFHDADSDAVTAAVVAMAGYFTYKAVQPPLPGLPTLRAFQDAQGVIARKWTAQRTGFS